MNLPVVRPRGTRGVRPDSQGGDGAELGARGACRRQHVVNCGLALCCYWLDCRIQLGIAGAPGAGCQTQHREQNPGRTAFDPRGHPRDRRPGEGQAATKSWQRRRLPITRGRLANLQTRGIPQLERNLPEAWPRRQRTRSHPELPAHAVMKHDVCKPGHDQNAMRVTLPRSAASSYATYHPLARPGRASHRLRE
jgi:hypothetical protein